MSAIDFIKRIDEAKDTAECEKIKAEPTAPLAKVKTKLERSEEKKGSRSRIQGQECLRMHL
eukprot:scaffold1328_cov162-Amphora_coffeaeformis.AAC.15